MILLLASLVVSSLSGLAANPVRLESGVYLPTEGNNPSICPQKVQTVLRDGLIRELRVAYVGDCYYEGPFTYECNDAGVCVSDTARFEILDATTYLWTNPEQNIWAKFKWKSENSNG